MLSPGRFAFALVWVMVFALGVARAEPVAAVVSTTLSTENKQVRQFAFDGDAKTFFASKEHPRKSDHFTLTFERPVPVTKFAVVTGKPEPEGTDKLEAGVLEVSPDGKTFSGLAQFSGGVAHCDLRGKRIQAVRITAAAAQDHPLAIREFTIASDPFVATFKYPIEIEVDCSDSPEMKKWTDKTARLCEHWYPVISEALRSDGYKPPHFIKMQVTKTYDAVAAASGDTITGSTKFFKDHPDDVGAMIHETTHVVQNYQADNNPGWLVEGIADYIRFFLFEPKKIGPIDARTARYDGSYRTTAAFLAYAAHRYDRSLVTKLNAALRAGTYNEALFKDLTGKPVQELDKEWRQTLKR